MNTYWLSLFTIFALSPFSSEPEAAANQKPSQPTGMQKGSRQVPEEQMIQSNPIITPAVAPHIADGTDTYCSVDFIWWKSVIGGAEYAYTGVIDGIAGAGVFTPFGGSTNEGRVGRPGFSFQPGFKAGLGVNFDHDGWDVYAEYTHLASQKETNSIAASPGIGERNVPGIITYNVYASKRVPLANASCKWKQSFNVVDLELGRDYFISRYLTLRPSAGLKTGWITELSKISYTPDTIYTDEDGANFLQNILLTYRQNMWGLGIRTALNAGWHITKNWAIYNDFAFSAFWADFHVHQKQNLTGTVSGQQTTLFTESSYQTVIPVLEAGLGFSFITWWSCNSYRFEFRAGWEEQIWLDFNHFMNLHESGNLSLHGLTLKAMLNF